MQRRTFLKYNRRDILFDHSMPSTSRKGPARFLDINMMISLALLISCYVVVIASETVPDESHFIQIVSVKKIYANNVDPVERQLQTDPSVSCSFEPHGQAISCVEQTPSNANIKYSVSCPAGVTVVDQCLQDQKRICYRFNSLPCIGGFYCAATNRFALDCGNLFALSNNNTCSKTDCDVNCAQIRDVPADYNSVPLANDCFQLGLSSSTSSDVVTTEWTHVLSDSMEIQVTGTRSSAATLFSTCQVTVRGQAGSSCPCRVDCAPNVNAISYDCTDFSNNGCAAIDCSGNCLATGFPSPVAAPVSPPVAAPVTPPVTAPVTPPVTAPVTPPVTAPVTPPVTAPVTPPVTAPVTPPVTAPVTPPVTAPVTPPVTAPVTPPVTAPVTPPVTAPVTPPVTAPDTPPATAPVTPPVTAPLTPPVAAPVTPPLFTPMTTPVNAPVVAPVSAPVSPPANPPVVAPVLSPVGIVTSPPVVRPVTAPSSNSTVCPIWWGLY